MSGIPSPVRLPPANECRGTYTASLLTLLQSRREPTFAFDIKGEGLRLTAPAATPARIPQSTEGAQPC